MKLIIYLELRDKWIVNKLLLNSIEPTIGVPKWQWIQNMTLDFAMRRFHFRHHKQKRKFRFDVFIDPNFVMA